MECHSIQFTTISINVERGIVKILFKYRYFQDLLIDIDINIDISQILLIDIDINIDIFQNHHIDIDIDIDIFQKCRYIDNRYVISIYRTGLSTCHVVNKTLMDTGLGPETTNSTTPWLAQNSNLSAFFLPTT